MNHRVRSGSPSGSNAYGWLIFVVLAAVGLYFVKWSPYYHRAFVAQAQHAIGPSILMGVASSAPQPSVTAALDYAWAYGKAIWQAMVLGLLLGSAVQVLLPQNWIVRALGARGLGSVVAGSLLALPGMMCTCCAAPVVVGLRERQASPGGAVAFWLGNTVLNPATLIFTGFVLGWNWTALRLVMGVALVLGVGWALNRGDKVSGAAGPAVDATSSRDDMNGAGVSAGLLGRRWWALLTRMSLRLIPEYLILVLLLGAARAWLFPQVGPHIGNEVLWIVALAVAGTLFVIPTAGEVPIIQAMQALGMGAGPAGALMMTLPPVSLPSLMMLSRSFRGADLARIALAVVLCGVLTGALAVALAF